MAIIRLSRSALRPDPDACTSPGRANQTAACRDATRAPEPTPSVHLDLPVLSAGQLRPPLPISRRTSGTPRMSSASPRRGRTAQREPVPSISLHRAAPVPSSVYDRYTRPLSQAAVGPGYTGPDA